MSQPVKPKRSSFAEGLRNILDNRLSILLAVPALVITLLLAYIPMFGIVVAFEDYKAASGFLSPWVGLRNFELLLTSPVLGRLIRNTIFLNVLFITFGTITAVGMALLLNEIGNRFFRRFSQSIMFLPFFMGWSIVSLLVSAFLDYNTGVIAGFMRSSGVEPVSFYEEPAWWPLIFVLLRIWKDTGSGCILYLAVLAGIDPQLYEAAAIDGASRLQRMRLISLPLLVPTIVLITLLALGRIFYGDLGMIYTVVGTNAATYETTDIIETYIIRAIQSTTNFGISIAVGMTQSVLGFITVFGSNWIVKKWSQRHGEDYSIF
jgi:putative aldouronate transport system permease protein